MLARWLGPALAVGGLIVFLLAPDVNGPLLVLLWTATILGYRYAVGLMARPAERVTIDGVMLVACLVLGFQGGWYFVPAVVAFAARDARARVGTPGWSPTAYTILAAAAAAWGWSVLAVVVSGRQAADIPTVPSGSAPAFGGTAADLAQAGLRDGRFETVVIVTTLLLGAILLGSLLRQAVRGRAPVALMALGIFGVLAVAAAGFFTVGPYLLPSVGLALVALWRAHAAPPANVRNGDPTARADAPIHLGVARTDVVDI